MALIYLIVAQVLVCFTTAAGSSVRYIASAIGTVDPFGGGAAQNNEAEMEPVALLQSDSELLQGWGAVERALQDTTSALRGWGAQKRSASMEIPADGSALQEITPLQGWGAQHRNGKLPNDDSLLVQRGGLPTIESNSMLEASNDPSPATSLLQTGAIEISEAIAEQDIEQSKRWEQIIVWGERLHVGQWHTPGGPCRNATLAATLVLLGALTLRTLRKSAGDRAPRRLGCRRPRQRNPLLACSDRGS